MADRRLLHRLCTATSPVALLAATALPMDGAWTAIDRYLPRPLRSSEFKQAVAETRTHSAYLSP